MTVCSLNLTLHPLSGTWTTKADHAEISATKYGLEAHIFEAKWAAV